MTNTNDPNRGVHGSSTVTPVDKKKGFNWLPWLLAALGLLLLLFTLSQCGGDREETDTAATTTTTTATATPQTNTTTYPDGSGTASTLNPDGSTVTTVTGNPAAQSVTLPGGQAMQLTPNTLNYDLQRFLASAEPAPRRFTFERLNFATASAELPTDAQQTVADLGRIMAAYPNARVRVEGYADARGSNPANAQLGAQRAEAVARALIGSGIAANRVTTATGGESNPVATNATAPGQAENRRTDLVVLSK